MSIEGAGGSHIKHGDKENYADREEFWGYFWFSDKLENVNLSENVNLEMASI